MNTIRPIPSLDLLRFLRSTRCLSNVQTSKFHHYNSIRSFSTTMKIQSQAENPYNPKTVPSSSSYSNSSRNQKIPMRKSTAPKTHDRGPTSKEDTQTDFQKMDILSTMSIPATSVDACTSDGFHLNNGVKTENNRMLVLLDGEAFTLTPRKSTRPGMLGLEKSDLEVLKLVYPKPDLLIIGTGPTLSMIGKDVKSYLTELGIRVDAMDTPNAAAAYNLLATERGTAEVGALLVPIGLNSKGKR